MLRQQQAGNVEEELKRMAASNSRIENEITELKEELDDIDKQQDRKQAEISQLENDIALETTSKKRTKDDQKLYWDNQKNKAIQEKNALEASVQKSQEMIQRLEIENEELLKEKASIQLRIKEARQEEATSQQQRQKQLAMQDAKNGQITAQRRELENEKLNSNNMKKDIDNLKHRASELEAAIKEISTQLE